MVDKKVQRVDWTYPADPVADFLNAYWKYVGNNPTRMWESCPECEGRGYVRVNEEVIRSREKEADMAEAKRLRELAEKLESKYAGSGD